MTTWGPTKLANATSGVYEVGSNGNVAAIAGAGTAFNNVNTWMGFRFTNVTVPQNATIDSATLELYTNPGKSGLDDVDGKFYGHNVDNASAWNIGSATYDISNRSLTNASYSYTQLNLGTGYQNFTVTTVIQEVVDRGGWASGNFLSLILNHAGSGNSALIANGATTYAQLTINYTAAGGGNQTVSPTGIASTLAIGTPTLVPGNVTVSASGISSTLAFGTPTIVPGAVTVNVSGIAPTLAFGTPTLVPGNVTVLVTGIASTAAIGTPTLAPGNVTVSVTGIASTVAIGTPTFQYDQTVNMTGIASTLAFGAPTLSISTVGDVDSNPLVVSVREKRFLKVYEEKQMTLREVFKDIRE